jgi:hypothetical protein
MQSGDGRWPRSTPRTRRLDLSPREARGVRKSAGVLRQTIDPLRKQNQPA